MAKLCEAAGILTPSVPTKGQLGAGVVVFPQKSSPVTTIVERMREVTAMRSAQVTKFIFF